MKKFYEVKVYRRYFTCNCRGEEVSRWYRSSHLTQRFTNAKEATKYFIDYNRRYKWQKAVMRIKHK